MYQMLDGDLSAGMNLTLGLAARGAGTLEVAVYRYGADGKGRGSVELGAFDLEPEWRLHELTYAHPPGASPRAALAFRAKGRAALDAVRVEPAD